MGQFPSARSFPRWGVRGLREILGVKLTLFREIGPARNHFTRVVKVKRRFTTADGASGFRLSPFIDGRSEALTSETVTVLLIL